MLEFLLNVSNYFFCFFGNKGTCLEIKGSSFESFMSLLKCSKYFRKIYLIISFSRIIINNINK